MIPSKATYAPGDEVVIELDQPAAVDGVLAVTHLEQEVARVPFAAGETRVALGTFPRGGYGVSSRDAATAFDVLDSRWERPRYGFIVQLTAEADIAAVTRSFRRLHLNAAQLYDWAYRHSQLMPPGRVYTDPLGQPRDLDVVDRMCAALSQAGSIPLGYAAVYAVGHDEAAEWDESLLLTEQGEPYRLGEDFLVLVDPAEKRWLAHLCAQLEQVVAETRIEGFHLDQYGWPKFATRGDGSRIDLAESFAAMLPAVRRAIPDSSFMFNNVNDFPTPVTAPLAQDATYIEVWEPHTTLGDLGALALAARAARPDHPPILSAYLSCYATADEGSASAAARLVMATAFSHGATHLLLGESGHALIDPYYPNNHVLTPESIDGMARSLDFAVRYGDLLYGAEKLDVTEYYAGGINEDVRLHAPGIAALTKAQAGTVWLRVVRGEHGIAVHLINLRAQDDVAWDHPKRAVEPVEGAILELSFVMSGATVYAASPDAPTMTALVSLGDGASVQVDALSAGQGGRRFALPTLGEWTLVWIPREAVLG